MPAEYDGWGPYYDPFWGPYWGNVLRVGGGSPVVIVHGAPPLR